MRKCLITFVCIIVSMHLSAQKFEPKWVGEVCVLNVNGDTIMTPAEKASVQVKTTQSAGRLLVGIGNVRQKVIVKGGQSPVQVSYDKPVTIVVKCKENDIDPSTFIQLIKFEEKSKERKTELAMENWIGNVSEGNMKLIPYEAEQYGRSSYILTVNPQEGEFGVRVLNPTDRDEKVPILYCYGSHNPSKSKNNYQCLEDMTNTGYLFNVDGIDYPVYKNSSDEYVIIGQNKKIRVLNEDELNKIISIVDNN